MTTNSLSEEYSLYLKQHADNPVNWYPWCKEAFQLAIEKDCPVFLSIGYSTCHWCHVMAHDSFEHREVAEILNTHFISVKVDREERPDIDSVYMDVCQMMTGSGGWPLTIIMTPDKKPFFAATYIPRENKHGRTGLIELLNKIVEIWDNDKERIFDSGLRIFEQLVNMQKRSSNIVLNKDVVENACRQLKRNYDPLYGGFGQSPKFPSPHILQFLLRVWKQTGNCDLLEMVEHTLLAMAMGGIHDHIGGGFHRYSTDEKWLVPHFEKMLYDQAMLLQAYSECFQITGNLVYEHVIKSTVEYLVRDMEDVQDGGFYSAEDADSEGIEGKFYIWNESELESILNKQDFSIVHQLYNTSFGGNFQEEHSGKKDGGNILHFQNEFHLGSHLKKIRETLFHERKKRIHPAKDEKKLTDWNALMISGFVKSFTATGENRYLELAEKTAHFIIEKRMETETNQLYHAVMGQKWIPAFLDDYAFTAEALIALYQCTFRDVYLDTAIKLADSMLNDFFDSDYGGFYFTISDSELFYRKKDSYDGAIPSGNSAAVNTLFKLSAMTGNMKYLHAAEKSVYCFADRVAGYPSGYCHLLSGFTGFLNGLDVAVIVSGKPEHEWQKDVARIRQLYCPDCALLLKTENNQYIEPIAHLLKNYKVIPGQTKIYYCSNFTCREPFENVESFLEWVQKKSDS